LVGSTLSVAIVLFLIYRTMYLKPMYRGLSLDSNIDSIIETNGCYGGRSSNSWICPLLKACTLAPRLFAVLSSRIRCRCGRCDVHFCRYRDCFEACSAFIW